MDRRTLRLLRNLTLLSAVAGAAPMGLQKLRQVLRTDAFAGYKRPQGMEVYDMRLQDVDFSHFRDTERITSAHADRIDMTADRFRTIMTGIRNGTYQDKDRKFKYEASHAEWNSGTNILAISGGVHVRDNKINLRGPEAVFDSKHKELRAKGGVTGKAFGGKFGSGGVTFWTDSDVYALEDVSWAGRVPKEFAQDSPVAVRQREWNFRSASSKNSKENPRIVTHVDAIATDGEVIVIAAKIVHNQDTDEFVATGTNDKQVQYFSGEANMVADEVKVFRKERRAIFTGKVVMMVKPKDQRDQKGKVEALPAYKPVSPKDVRGERPAGGRSKEEIDQDEQVRQTKSIRDYPLAMNATKIEYWYAKGSRRAVITGSPQGRQELPNGRWRHLWTHVAYYDGEKEELKLVSTSGQKDTRMINSVGDDASADFFIVSTAEDSEEFSGAGIVGDFADLSGEDPRDEDKKTAPPKANGGGNGQQRPPPPRFPKV